jgi:hypothetical protein
MFARWASINLKFVSYIFIISITNQQMNNCAFIPISRSTDATCDRFLFSIYMCITLHFPSVKRSSSGVLHRTYSLQFLCLCLSAALSCKKLLFLTRQKIKIYYKLHLLVYLLEYMKMHGPGNKQLCTCWFKTL